jgi:glycosyltransferase involved in cell wall biosynthesis
LELASLRRKITETKLGDNIVIKGRCSDTELYGLMKTSKVFIFPSIFEGWGIAVAEALACGLPVVAYDIPALREIFAPCQSVFLVPVSDTDKMTQTVSSLLSSGNKEFSDASITYAGRFEWERVARADLEAIGRVISGNLG